MANSVITFTVANGTNSSTVTKTLTSQDFQAAQQWLQYAMKNGGFYDDLNNFYVSSSVLKASIA